MRSSALFSAAAAAALTLLRPVAALRANTDSPCAAACGNELDSTLGSRDIVCTDNDLAMATGTGAVYNGCIACQLASHYVDPVTQESDLQWGLYNMRYAVSWCLFGYPSRNNTPDTPCRTSTACGNLAEFFEKSALATNVSEYAYCDNLNDVQVPKCGACLVALTDSFFLNNFLSMLVGACKFRPPSGQTLSIQGSVFSTTEQANVTSPTQTPVASSHASGLSVGAKVGIAIASVLGAIIVIAAAIICCCRRRRRQRQAMDPMNPHGAEKSFGPGGEAFEEMPYPQPYIDSPGSTMHLAQQPWPTSMDESLSATSGPHTWSPYPEDGQWTSSASGAASLSFRNLEWPMSQPGAPQPPPWIPTHEPRGTLERQTSFTHAAEKER